MVLQAQEVSQPQRHIQWHCHRQRGARGRTLALHILRNQIFNKPASASAPLECVCSTAKLQSPNDEKWLSFAQCTEGEAHCQCRQEEGAVLQGPPQEVRAPKSHLAHAQVVFGS